MIEIPLLIQFTEKTKLIKSENHEIWVKCETGASSRQAFAKFYLLLLIHTYLCDAVIETSSVEA